MLSRRTNVLIYQPWDLEMGTGSFKRRETTCSKSLFMKSGWKRRPAQEHLIIKWGEGVTFCHHFLITVWNIYDWHVQQEPELRDTEAWICSGKLTLIKTVPGYVCYTPGAEEHHLILKIRFIISSGCVLLPLCAHSNYHNKPGAVISQQRTTAHKAQMVEEQGSYGPRASDQAPIIHHWRREAAVCSSSYSSILTWVWLKFTVDIRHICDRCDTRGRVGCESTTSSPSLSGQWENRKRFLLCLCFNNEATQQKEFKLTKLCFHSLSPNHTDFYSDPPSVFVFSS